MDVAERIHEANQRFMEAIRAGDSATMPSLYTSDATILPPNTDRKLAETRFPLDGL